MIDSYPVENIDSISTLFPGIISVQSGEAGEKTGERWTTEGGIITIYSVRILKNLLPISVDNFDGTVINLMTSDVQG